MSFWCFPVLHLHVLQVTRVHVISWV